jgi:integrase/recombinase XerD
MNEPKVIVYFESRRPVVHAGVKNRCHIKIMLTYYDHGIRQRRYYKTNLFATADEFRKQQTGKYGKGDQEAKDYLDNLRITLQGLEIKANKCLKNFTTDEEFEKQFYSAGNFENPLDLMLAYVAELDAAGRIGHRDYIKSARSSFVKFSKGKLSFSQVTPSWLMKYENHMIEQENSISTVGMYCRAMRIIFNLASSDKYRTIPKELYPFGLAKHGKYQIPTSKGTKRALTPAQKDKVLKYRTLNQSVQKAVDMWIFSYYCNGINFTDMARLKFRDIQEDMIVFVRSKTQLSNRDQESIQAIVNDHVREIIARWGNKSLNPGDYIFPVLRAGLTPSQVAEKVHDFIADTNEELEIACEELDIPKITTYWARHTHAMILRGNDVSIDQIRQNLGHAEESTTQAYLNSIDIERKKKAAGFL